MEKAFKTSICVVCSLVLLLYMYTGTFAFPSGDDFTYALMGQHDNWVDIVLDERERWNGRYLSNFLVIQSPLNVGGLQLYQLMPSLITLFSLGCLWLSGALIKLKEPLLIALVSLTLTYSIVPDITEAIFWYTGAVSYIPAGAIFLVSISWLFRNWNGGFFRILPVYLLQFIASGFNEVIPILSAFTFLLMLAFKNKFNRMLLLTLFQFGLVYYIMEAPGNANRAAHFPEKHNIIRSGLMAWAYTFRFIGEWLLNPAIWAWGLVLLIPKWDEALVKKLKYFSNPIVLFFALVGPTYLAAFGPLYSTGLLGQYRTANLAAFLFIPIFTIAVIRFSKLYQERIQLKIPVKGAIIALVLGLGLWKNQLFLYSDWVTGEITGFSAEMENRIKTLQNHKEKPVSIPLIEHRSKTLFVYDLTQDSKNWKNESYQLFFKTGPVTISEIRK